MRKRQRSANFTLIFIFIAGFLLHFLYTWSGELRVLAPFAAVNESVFEHGKLVFWPLCIAFLWRGIRKNGSFQEAFIGAAFASVCGTVLMIMLYYTYYYGFAAKSNWVNIANFFVSSTAGYFLGAWAVKKQHTLSTLLTVSFFCLFLFGLFAFFYFSFHPLSLPLFIPKA